MPYDITLRCHENENVTDEPDPDHHDRLQVFSPRTVPHASEKNNENLKMFPPTGTDPGVARARITTILSKDKKTKTQEFFFFNPV